MKYKLKYHFAAAYVLAVVLAGFTSCEKRFEMDLPLAVSSHTLKFGTAGGSTHILVYSTGQWQISFDKKIDRFRFCFRLFRRLGRQIFSYRAVTDRISFHLFHFAIVL